MSNPNAERERILSKIRQMAELANPERGGTKFEVETAAALMQKLMDQHNISMLEVMQTKKDDPNTFTETVCSTGLGQTKEWHWGLARAIARITTTRHFSTLDWGKSVREPKGKNKKIGRMSFFGSKVSTEAAADLFDIWVVYIDGLATQAVAEYITEAEKQYAPLMRAYSVKQFRHLPGLEDEHPNVWRVSWLLGVISGINAVLREQEEAREKEVGMAMVLVNEALVKAYQVRSQAFTMRNTKSRGVGNYGAYSAGTKVGRGLDLTPKKKLGG